MCSSTLEFLVQIMMSSVDRLDIESLYNKMTVSQIKNNASEPNITGTPKVS